MVGEIKNFFDYTMNKGEMNMLKGYGKLENTKDYLSKKSVNKISENELYALSSICCGTYLGLPCEEVDLAYSSAIKEAIKKGINLIDTAINYRGMRSEVIVGKAIKELIENHKLKRSEIVIATKGGFLPADYRDTEMGEDFRKFYSNDVNDYFLNTILPSIKCCKATQESVLERGNTVEAEIINYLFELSRKNLNLETIDIYYLHNPEVSKVYLGEELFYKELHKTIELLENKVSEGSLRYYGISTYSGFITNSDGDAFLSLERIVKIVEEVAGKDHHFKFIQLPLNKAMRSGELDKTQKVNGHWLSALDAAKKLNLKVMTNISLAQGKAFDKYSFEEMIAYLLYNEKVCASLIGMKSIANVERNINIIL